jgi:hypothetical protein
MILILLTINGCRLPPIHILIVEMGKYILENQITESHCDYVSIIKVVFDFRDDQLLVVRPLFPSLCSVSFSDYV